MLRFKAQENEERQILLNNSCWYFVTSAEFKKEKNEQNKGTRLLLKFEMNFYLYSHNKFVC